MGYGMDLEKFYVGSLFGLIIRFRIDEKDVFIGVLIFLRNNVGEWGCFV